MQKWAKFSAYQMGFGFNTTTLELVGIETGDLPNYSISDFNVEQDKGQIKTMWYDNGGENVFVESGKTFFSLTFDALAEVCNIEDHLYLDDDVLKNGIYNKGLSFDFPYELGFKVSPNEVKNFLLDVYPNPVSNGQGTISIDIKLENTSEVKVNVF